MLPTDFQAAKPRRAAPSQREVGAISARRPAQGNGTACCGDSERAPQFPSSQSSESHAQNTTPCVIRQAADDHWSARRRLVFVARYMKGELMVVGMRRMLRLRRNRVPLQQFITCPYRKPYTARTPLKSTTFINRKLRPHESGQAGDWAPERKTRMPLERTPASSIHVGFKIMLRSIIFSFSLSRSVC